MTRPPKARIRQSFERAALTYDSAAAIQRRICDRLLADLPVSLTAGRVLDAGCGTGYALTLLRSRYPLASLIALDLSSAMLCHAGQGSLRLAADLERLPLAGRQIDLYWSSLAVQWCDLAAALGEAHRCLRTGGQLALASLGPDTFHELRQVFAAVDAHRHTIAFHTPEEIAGIAATAGFGAIRIERRRETAFYPDFRALLKAVKAVGANQLGEGRRTSLMSRAAFARAETAYAALRTAEGLPLSYDVIELHATA